MDSPKKCEWLGVIGVIGFSAGGNLAAKASAPVEPRSSAALDAVDQQSCRPDFAVLVYPACRTTSSA